MKDGTFSCPERHTAIPNQDIWRGPFPHTCSYCGSLRADDAIRLLSEGAYLEKTTKGYKHYIDSDKYGMKKLYSWHVSKGDIEKINLAIKSFKETPPEE